MKNKGNWIHIVFLVAIVTIIGIAAFRLYKWNKGTDREADIEQIDPAEFDVEALDMILPMDAALLEGHEDDELNILCLGNNPFSDERDEDGLAFKIGQRTDADHVYNCAFPDSSAACKYAEYNPDYVLDHFNFYYVVNFLAQQSFTAIQSIASNNPDPRYLEAAMEMETVDMDKIDVILIMYDSTDYNNGTPTDNPNNEYDITAFTGGLTVGLNLIKQTWPWIRIYVMTPTYALYLDEDGEMHSGTTYNAGNGALPHYVQKEIDATMACGVSIVDNFYGTINEDNYSDYMKDEKRYNENGRNLLADRIAYIINNKMSVVSAQQG